VSLGAAGLEISRSNLVFHISLIQIENLKPHEEVIEALVKSLAHSIRTQGIVRDPLIVDQDELVVLDGMHRLASLKLLKCRFAPCCLVDYNNPLIKVGSWFRLFGIENAESAVTDLLKEKELGYVEEKTKNERARIDPRTIIFTKNGYCYKLQQISDEVELARTAVNLERELTKRGCRVEYQPETVAFQQLISKSTDLVITVPVFTKQQIRELGCRGLLLPHKVTRHVMPSRPLRVDVPLSVLTSENTSQTEADQELRALLSARNVERKPPGSVVDGRRYEEELLVFSA
jgi:hypothetical protein